MIERTFFFFQPKFFTSSKTPRRGVSQGIKLKRTQDLISVHDADYVSSQHQAKKALMCLPAAKPPTPMLYSQQLPLKNLYTQFPAGLLDTHGATIPSLDTCPLLLQTASLPSLSHIGLPHSLESSVLHSASEPPMEMRIDTSKHFHVFVGDLSKDVSNELLKSTFQKFGEVSEAKVIRDAQTQKSKGYGFVSFPNKQNAENAISGMNGKWIGKRAVRTNWAARKNSEENRDKLTFEQVFNSTKADNTSVYVGNISPQTTDADLRDSFSTYGDIAEVRVFKTQRYAFVRYEKKECATKAIMEMNGKELAGNQVRCSWGRTQAVPNQALNPLPIDLSSLMMPTMMPTTIPLIQNPFLNYEPATLLYSSFPQW
ncbi:hypothetical protein L5515_017216 [Caenorhabditis briggsae]|uniref:RRM domain-containing protein n=2 Tax=Caenorhabditis briggsae TaxID=6238 RepID=A0AAE9JQK2_CAEBR|nr:hypothetical protein L5515_017216 [Caenorhabditis briggsae]